LEKPDRLVFDLDPEKGLDVEQVKAGARKNRIFIDWLHNDRGATAVAPYSVRARPRAPVAVSWAELDKLSSADGFTIKDMQQRLRRACPYLAALAKPQTLGNTALTRLQQLNH
jgi:bifunctional non-homologous end joining protein LigD